MTSRLLHLDDIDPNWKTSGRWRLGAGPDEPGGMVLPVSILFLHHTVTADTGNVVADVAKVCDIDQGRFNKVSYSWNIHESTSTWVETEGVHRGAHTINNLNESLNGISFGLGVIGNFQPGASPPARPASDALVELIAEGIVTNIAKPGLAAPGFLIKGHRDSPYATACCGDLLYARLPDIRAAVARLLNTSPSEEEFMNPASVLDVSNRMWQFVRGRDNGHLYAQVLDPKVLDDKDQPHVLWDWFEIPGGIISSGPAATRMNDGRLCVTGRGLDARTYGVIIAPNPPDAAGPVGNVTKWFGLGGLS